MGGRGASSGISVSGNKYGTEFSTLYQSGNIKFVRYNNSGSAKSPMETMTQGRIYATINAKDKLKSITYYDKNNKRYKQVDVDHQHEVNGVLTKPHTHKGYKHNEHGDFQLSPKEKKMVERVENTWYHFLSSHE